jgi:PAS domain S-box-containing protein
MMVSPAPDSEQLGETLLRGQHAVLESIAVGKPRKDVLERLCGIVEEACPGTLCSVLLVTSDGQHLRHGAGPMLAEGYCRLINGIAIGPAIGSCGTAAFRRELVVATDIKNDPLWLGYEDLALQFGLLSCASMPILVGPEASLLGTFAIYHRTAGPFVEHEIDVLRRMSNLAALVIIHYQREEALKENELRLARTTSLSHVIECSIALDGKFRDPPPALCTLLGRTREELLERRLHDVIHPKDLEADQGEYQRLLSGEREHFPTEARVFARDGALCWLAINYYCVKNEDGEPIQLNAYLLDISRLKHAEETLRASQKMEGFGLLAPGLAHDFNNLLTAILCNASLAQDVVGKTSPVGETIETIETIARRAAELVRQTLSYAVTGHVIKKPVDLNQVVNEITQVLSTSFLLNVDVTLDLAHGLPKVLGDAAQIHQVVMNLVINAAQAIGSINGTIRLSTRSTELRGEDLRARFADQLLTEGDYVTLDVSDTGGGMAKEILQRIFEPFFTTKPTGRGVGLAVAMGILREHRAGLEVTSEVGHGSSFRVYFPVASAQQSQPTTRANAVPWPGVRGKVLVIDDDRLIRSAITRMLRSLGFECFEATNGQDALLQLAKRRAEIALVLLDLTSPRMGGRETLSIIAERWPDLNVILTIAEEDPELDRLPANVLTLRKPYNLLDLKRAMFGD